ncbi:hypothetical protein EON67_11400 [archaeon]|nr:MAG: hypothetical protein EON67_11400 [archaeon]
MRQVPATFAPYAAHLLQLCMAHAHTRARTPWLQMSIMTMLGDHPGIVRLLDVFETSTTIQLVMERMSHELYAEITQRGAYTEADAAKAMYRLTSAVHYMHERGVAHRDIKPENLLLPHNAPRFDLRICDFGLARMSHNSPDGYMHTVCGYVAWVRSCHVRDVS